MATRNTQGFDRGETPSFPDMACIGTVAGVGAGKSFDNGATTTFPVEIKSGGNVPVKHRGSIRLAPDFLNPAFKRKELATVENGSQLDWIYDTNLAASEYINNEDPVTGEVTKVKNRTIPHLLGLTGIDYSAYAEVTKALFALWPDYVDEASIQAVLDSHLKGRNIGYWLVQQVNMVAEVDGRKIFEPTRYFNVKTPRFLDAAYFSPSEKGRQYVLDQIAKQKTRRPDGQAWRAACFDIGTPFPTI